MRDEPVPLKAPGIILGVGLGGFFDGIFLHQIFQLHHMFSSRVTVENLSWLEMNTIGNGLFHTITWLSVLLGLYLLYSRIAEAQGPVWASKVLWGWILSGWGWFNLVEGLVDHQILGLHHVYAGPNQFLWDMLFLASGAIFIFVGWFIARQGTKDPDVPRRT